jgi:protein-L-isoaspartate(D-aspartate) O-methyltransferase
MTNLQNTNIQTEIDQNHSINQAVNMIKGQLATNGIHNEAVVNAIASVDRSFFVPEYAKDSAYVDEELRMCNNRYLLEPLLFASMINYAEIEKNHKVLDIGSGYGYSSAIIAHLANEVYALEESPELVSASRKKFAAKSIENVEAISAPLENGYAAHAPYDRIIINGALQSIPASIESQLVEGGIIVGLIASSKNFATKKTLASIVVGKKTDGSVGYLTKKNHLTFYLKKLNEKTQFIF